MAPWGQQSERRLATTSLNDFEANWNRQTGGQTDRRTGLDVCTYCSKKQAHQVLCKLENIQIQFQGIILSYLKINLVTSVSLREGLKPRITYKPCNNCQLQDWSLIQSCLNIQLVTSVSYKRQIEGWSQTQSYLNIQLVTSVSFRVALKPRFA